MLLRAGEASASTAPRPGVASRVDCVGMRPGVLPRSRPPCQCQRPFRKSVWTRNVARKDKATVQQVDTSPRDSEAFDLSVEEEGLALASLQNVEDAVDKETKGEAVAVWVGAAFAFGVGIWYFLGPEKAEEYFAGYVLEQSLSVDNLFVFILVFNYFQTPPEYQAKVLTYGIITAAALRLVMILLGVELVESFKPVLLGFAALLLYSSYKLVLDNEEEEEDLSDNAVVQWCHRIMQVSDDYDGERFFTIDDGVRVATPLLLALAVVEISDVVFAVDSIPAVFGVTLDPFIVYTSNLFAILSLRSLYGFVSVIMTELKYLDKAVALVLGFIGSKMIADFSGYHISTEASLLVVGVLLGGGVAGSLLLADCAEETES